MSADHREVLTAERFTEMFFTEDRLDFRDVIIHGDVDLLFTGASPIRVPGCLDLSGATIRGRLRIHNLHMHDGCKIIGVGTRVGCYDISNTHLSF